jgi:hypothetical protein
MVGRLTLDQVVKVRVLAPQPRRSPAPAGFSVSVAGARPPVRLAICVPAGGYADATITTSGKARIPEGRVVALHLDGLDVSDAASPSESAAPAPSAPRGC